RLRRPRREGSERRRGARRADEASLPIANRVDVVRLERAPVPTARQLDVVAAAHVADVEAAPAGVAAKIDADDASAAIVTDVGHAAAIVDAVDDAGDVAVVIAVPVIRPVHVIDVDRSAAEDAAENDLHADAQAASAIAEIRLWNPIRLTPAVHPHAIAVALVRERRDASPRRHAIVLAIRARGRVVATLHFAASAIVARVTRVTRVTSAARLRKRRSGRHQRE